MQDMEEQLISRLLEEGMVKSDAGRGAQRLRHSLEAVRKAESAIEKLRRSLNRQQVAIILALPPMHPDAGTICQCGDRAAPAAARRSSSWQRKTGLVDPEETAPCQAQASSSCCPAQGLHVECVDVRTALACLDHAASPGPASVCNCSVEPYIIALTRLELYQEGFVWQRHRSLPQTWVLPVKQCESRTGF